MDTIQNRQTLNSALWKDLISMEHTEACLDWQLNYNIILKSSVNSLTMWGKKKLQTH